jgi:transglutaminase-like putative cysteine protease
MRSNFVILATSMSSHRGVLGNGYGSCFQQVDLWAQLCRLAGVPARMVCGVTLNGARRTEPNVRFDVRALGASPFAHAWGEFYSESDGWVPFELRGDGVRRLNASNTTSAGSRELLERSIALYDTELFGYLRPFRVFVGDDLLRVSTNLQGGRPALRLASRLAHHTVFEVSCEFARL